MNPASLENKRGQFANVIQSLSILLYNVTLLCINAEVVFENKIKIFLFILFFSPFAT